MKKILAALALLVAVALPIRALAQAAPTVPDVGASVEQLVQTLAAASGAHDWRVVAGTACILAIWILRLLAGSIPGRVGAFFKTDRGGAMMALSVGLLGSAARALALPGPFSGQALVDGLVMAVVSAGGYTMFKKIFSKVPAAAVANVAVVGLLVGALSLPGCAWLQKHPIVAGELGCAEQAVVAALPSVFSDVTKALAGASPDWGALGTLEAQNGPDVIRCAVLAITAPHPGAALDANVERNARTYLSVGGHSGWATSSARQ